MLQLKMKTPQKVDICFACSEAKTADGQISSSKLCLCWNDRNYDRITARLSTPNRNFLNRKSWSTDPK